MSDRVEVTRGSGDLERKLWVFTIVRFPVVTLENYSEQTRKTKRHKFKDGREYSRLDSRHNQIKGEPEVPADVLEEAMEKYAEMLEFKVWSR